MIMQQNLPWVGGIALQYPEIFQIAFVYEVSTLLLQQNTLSNVEKYRKTFDV